MEPVLVLVLSIAAVMLVGVAILFLANATGDGSQRGVPTR